MSFTLTANGQDFTRWNRASLTMSIEQPVNAFSFTAPHPQKDVTIKAQDNIEIAINGAADVAGKIYQITGTGDASNATRTFKGRSTMAEPVDASAPITPGSWSDVSVKTIIDQLLKPFGITTDFKITPPGTTSLSLNPGDTVWAAIDKLLKKENLLAFELAPNVLTIARAPESGAVAALEFGTQDILEIQNYDLNLTNRFHKYTVIGQGVLGLSQNPIGTATDDNISPATREIIIQLSGDVDDADCQQMAAYEASVRAARSISFSYKVPSWFNKNGGLWLPNQRVTIIDNENGINGEHLLTTVTFNETESDEWAVLKFTAPESYTLKPPPPPAEDDLFG